MCDTHRTAHHAIEHTSPEQGRYRAVIAHPDIARTRYADMPRIPNLRYPRDMTLGHPDTPRTGDWLRLVEHVR
jgi:hypothetical protein